jgi:hypothetical protein
MLHLDDLALSLTKCLSGLAHFVIVCAQGGEALGAGVDPLNQHFHHLRLVAFFAALLITAVGQCRLKPTLKAPASKRLKSKRLKLKCVYFFQLLLRNSTCAATPRRPLRWYSPWPRCWPSGWC